jgi:hypothetical protein
MEQFSAEQLSVIAAWLRDGSQTILRRPSNLGRDEYDCAQADALDTAAGYLDQGAFNWNE